MYQKEGVVSGVNEGDCCSRFPQPEKKCQNEAGKKQKCQKGKKKQQMLVIYTSMPNLNRQGGQKGEENNKEKSWVKKYFLPALSIYSNRNMGKR